MIVIKIALFLAILATHFPLFSQTQSNPGAELHFYAAHPGGPFVTFDSPVALNWETLLPDSIRFLVENTDQEEVLQRIADRRGMFGSTFEYSLDVSAQVPNRWYYLLSPQGFFPVTLKGIKGTVRFIFRSNMEDDRRIARVQYSGQLVGTVEGDTSASKYGFAVWTESPLYGTIMPSSLSADALHGNTSYYKRGTDFWGMVNQYAITFSELDGKYVFVQWVPDAQCLEGCCAIRLSLYQIGDSNVLVQSNNFNCDI